MKTKRMLAALSGQKTDRPPFWFMRQAGRYMPEYRAVRSATGSFLDLCFNVEKATEVTLQPIDAFDMDAAILFSDILTIPLGLGQNVWFEEGEGPKLSAINSISELPSFDENRIHEKLGNVFEAVGSIKSALPDDKALIGFAGAPWTVATYMIEGGSSKNFLKAKSFAFGRPDEFQELVDLLVHATSIYLKQQCAKGAEVLQIFDSWAGALDQEGQKRWSFAPMKAIAENVKAAYPDVKIIAFGRGVGQNAIELAKIDAFDGLSMDSTVSLSWAKENLQPTVALQGNLDPIAVVAGGAEMERKALQIIEAWRDGGFVFNLSHGIVPQTPVEHVAALANLIKASS